MIDKTTKRDNINPRTIDKAMRLNITHGDNITEVIKRNNKSNIDERKVRLNLYAAELKIRNNLIKKYHGAELKQKIKKTMERALRPCAPPVEKPAPILANSGHKATKSKMRSRRR